MPLVIARRRVESFSKSVLMELVKEFEWDTYREVSKRQGAKVLAAVQQDLQACELLLLPLLIHMVKSCQYIGRCIFQLQQAEPPDMCCCLPACTLALMSSFLESGAPTFFSQGLPCSALTILAHIYIGGRAHTKGRYWVGSLPSRKPSSWSKLLMSVRSIFSCRLSLSRASLRERLYEHQTLFQPVQQSKLRKGSNLQTLWYYLREARRAHSLAGLGNPDSMTLGTPQTLSVLLRLSSPALVPQPMGGFLPHYRTLGPLQHLSFFTRSLP